MLLRFLILPALVCLLAGILSGQSNVTNAALEGYVTDTSGGAIANADVSVVSAFTNQQTTTLTDQSGYFRFQVLRLDTYTLRVSASEFGTYEKENILLTAGQLARVNISLSPAAREQSLEVSATVNVVSEAGATSVGTVLEEKTVQSLPVPSRNPLNFHLFGVGAKGMPSPNLSLPIFNFGGQYRYTLNHDGLDNTQRLQSLTTRASLTPVDSIKEVQVLASNYTAEFGRSSAGVVNILTQSGSNDFHGQGTGFVRPDAAAARPPLAATRPVFDWAMAAISAGGPVRRNRAFFFGNYEWFGPSTPNAVVIDPVAANALGLDQEATGPGGQTQNFHTINARGDYVLGENNLGFVRFSRFYGMTTQTSGGLEPRYRVSDIPDRTYAFTGQLASTRGRSMNEFRLGFFNRQTDVRIGQPPSGAEPWDVVLTGQAIIGRNPEASTVSIARSWHVIDVFSQTRGPVSFKAGIDYLYYLSDLKLGFTRRYTFTGVAAVPGVRAALTPLEQYQATRAGRIDPATGSAFTYSLLQQDLGLDQAAPPSHSMAAFFTAEWRVSRQLNLTLGARYDLQVNSDLDPEAPFPLSRTLNTDGNNIAPRIGLVWSPMRNGGTIFRFGYGTYYDMLLQQMVVNATLRNGKNLLTYSVPGTAAGAPAYGRLLETGPSSFVVRPDITAFTPDLQNLYSHHATAQLDQRISDSLSVGAAYQFIGGRHVGTRRDINLGAPAGRLADGRPVFRGAAGRPDTQFGAVYLIESGGTSNYNGLDLWIRKRLNRGIVFGSTFSWSHALSDSHGSDLAPHQDPENRRGDYGNSDIDVRHYWTTYGVLEMSGLAPKAGFLRGVALSLTNYFNSGLPVNGVAGPDLNADTNLNDRVLFRGRNSFRSGNINELDVRLARDFTFRERFSFQLSVESQNVLNKTNVGCGGMGCTSAYVNAESRSDFLRVISTRNARILQFGGRIRF